MLLFYWGGFQNSSAEDVLLQRAGQVWRQSLDLVRVARAVRAHSAAYVRMPVFFICLRHRSASLHAALGTSTSAAAACSVRLHPMGTTDTHWLTKSCRTRCTHPSCRGEECASIVRMLCCRSGTCRAAWHQVRHKRRCCSARLRLRADGHDADLLACCIMSRTLYAPKLPPKQMRHHFWAQRAPIQHPSSGNSAAAAPAFTQLSATQQWPTSKHDAAT